LSACIICLAQGVVSGAVHFPSEADIYLKFKIEPVEGSDFEGTRERIELKDATIESRSEDGSSLIASGWLEGPFGIENRDLYANATVEVFFRDGDVAFVQVSVNRNGETEDDGVLFAANLRLHPGGDAAEGTPIKGLAFAGRLESAEAE
jgi:hypothetical protein